MSIRTRLMQAESLRIRKEVACGRADVEGIIIVLGYIIMTLYWRDLFVIQLCQRAHSSHVQNINIKSVVKIFT